MKPATQKRYTATGFYPRTNEKGVSVAATHPHDLLDELAQLLKIAVQDLRAVSIQDLELACRARGTSLVVLVRAAESTVQRLQQDRDGHIQSLGDDDQVLDSPTGPPP
jgi:hypothetical protein